MTNLLITRKGNKLTVTGKKVDMNYVARLQAKGFIVTVVIK